MREHYLLSEVAKVLGKRPHQITYPIVTGKIEEPATRIAGKRLFTPEDVSRLSKHFGVSPKWEALDPVARDVVDERPAQLTLRPPFDVMQTGESGHEVRDGDGEVFAWASDRGHALVLAGLLEAAARG